jgi:hypothetical protein
MHTGVCEFSRITRDENVHCEVVLLIIFTI